VVAAGEHIGRHQPCRAGANHGNLSGIGPRHSEIALILRDLPQGQVPVNGMEPVEHPPNLSGGEVHHADAIPRE
jgi:hypothetical protein